MTANQIAYWNYMESKRSNQSREAETSRANRAKESVEWANLGETTRANKAREDETHRANVANEYFNAQKHTETVRSNKANEEINTKKHEETVRSNKANEEIAKEGNAIKREGAYVGAFGKMAPTFDRWFNQWFGSPSNVPNPSGIPGQKQLPPGKSVAAAASAITKSGAAEWIGLVAAASAKKDNSEIINKIYDRLGVPVDDPRRKDKSIRSKIEQVAAEITKRYKENNNG